MRTTEPSFAAPSKRPRPARRASRGVSLIFALLTLMALSLAAIALVRAVDTGALVLGNLGFKQGTTAVADTATRQAVRWISSYATLTADNGGVGYYSTSNDAVDVTGQQSTDPARPLIDWDQDGCGYAAASPHGNCTMRASDPIQIDSSTTARYVIFRLCQSTGDPNSGSNTCARPLSSDASNTAKKGKLDYGDYERFNNVSGVYYRIVVRVVGPRNAVSFIETIVHQ